MHSVGAAAISAAGIALLSAYGVGAQQTETVWASVAYLYHGDRTPLLGKTPPALTPLGAQQMYAQGSAFRARYLKSDEPLTSEEFLITTKAPIFDIEEHAIDNTMLTVVTNQDQYVTASALAFLQALYPPSNQTFADNAGGIEAALLADGSITDFPLRGYQYPNIESLSVLDPNSIWLVVSVWS